MQNRTLTAQFAACPFLPASLHPICRSVVCLLRVLVVVLVPVPLPFLTRRRHARFGVRGALQAERYTPFPAFLSLKISDFARIESGNSDRL